MIARVGVTLAALLLALIAFLGGGPTEPGLLNPFGLLFAFLAGLAWFAWDAIVGGYASDRPATDGAELPLLARFAPVLIKGVTTGIADLCRPRRQPARTPSQASARAEPLPSPEGPWARSRERRPGGV